MTSRSVSNSSNFSLPRRPSTNSNSPSVGGHVGDYSEADYLNGNLLDDDDDGGSPPSRKHNNDLPRQRKSDENADDSHKLVIAIDYGTTYTGKLSVNGLTDVF
jgi:hypothetical protein